MSQYLELSFPTSKKGWHRKLFYLFDPSRSLPAYSLERLGPAMPFSCKSLLDGPTLEVTDGLLGQITALKDVGLTGWTVL